MSKNRLTWLVALAGVAAFLSSGCGGTGAATGSSSTGGSNTGNAGSNGSNGSTGVSTQTQVFAVDDLNTGFDHVWVTIDTISLTSSGGGSTTIFDATSLGGTVVDLRTLRDATGAKFLLLGGFNTPKGSYTGVNVTVAPGLTIFPTGAATGTAATFANATGKTYTLSLAFPSSQTISPTNKVIVDFDLANWTLSGTTVSAPNNAFLTVGSSTGLGESGRGVAADYVGAVSGLAGTSPAQTFSLSQGKFSMNIATNASTTIVNSNGSSSPVLANNQTVDVTGAFDATTNALVATSITIGVASKTAPPALVTGVVTAFDASAQTLTLQLQGCDRFEPRSNSVTVSVGTSTVFFGLSGVTDTEAQFYAGLVDSTTQVTAVGSVSDSTLSAVQIGIVGPPVPPTTVDTAIMGPVSNPNATAGTFDIVSNSWEGGGRLDPKGTTIHVVTTTSTTFQDNGAAGTQAGFFSTLTSSTQAQVRGSLDPTTQTLTATLVATGAGGSFHF